MSNYIDIDDMHLMERTRCDAADQNWDSAAVEAGIGKRILVLRS
jgi:hypothetical protein